MRYKIIHRDGRKTISKKKDQMGEEKRDTDVGYRTIQEDGQDGQKGHNHDQCSSEQLGETTQ